MCEIVEKNVYDFITNAYTERGCNYFHNGGNKDRVDVFRNEAGVTRSFIIAK